jgi:hypothetical protein
MSRLPPHYPPMVIEWYSAIPGLVLFSIRIGAWSILENYFRGK